MMCAFMASGGYLGYIASDNIYDVICLLQTHQPAYACSLCASVRHQAEVSMI